MSTLRKEMLQVMQQRNYCKRTINSYIGTMVHLSQYYKKSPDLLTVKEVNDYIHYCITERGLSTSFTNQLIGAFKILTVNVLKREWVTLDYPRPRYEKRLPAVLSKEEISKIIEVTKNLKHKTIIMLAYSAGLRISEVINLKPADIDSQRMQILVHQGKGHKDRNVVLSEVILEQLRMYWKKYRPEVYLFEGYTDGLPYAARSIQCVFKKSLKLTGITKPASFHTLRHSYATHLVEDGVSVIIIQRLLGHKNLKSTSVYLHLQHYDISKIKSPLDTLNA